VTARAAIMEATLDGPLKTLHLRHTRWSNVGHAG